MSFTNAVADLDVQEHCDRFECRLTSKGVELLEPQITYPRGGQLWSLFSSISFSSPPTPSHSQDGNEECEDSQHESPTDDSLTLMQRQLLPRFFDGHDFIHQRRPTPGHRIGFWFLSVAAIWTSYVPQLIFTTELTSDGFRWQQILDEARPTHS